MPPKIFRYHKLSHFFTF